AWPPPTHTAPLPPRSPLSTPRAARPPAPPAMPELPEVETIRAHLAPFLEGRRFDHVEIVDHRLTRPDDPREVAAELEGESVSALERRGKYLVVRFESGRALLVHLRMTGSLAYAPAGTFENDPY